MVMSIVGSWPLRSPACSSTRTSWKRVHLRRWNRSSWPRWIHHRSTVLPTPDYASLPSRPLSLHLRTITELQRPCQLCAHNEDNKPSQGNLSVLVMRELQQSGWVCVLVGANLMVKQVSLPSATVTINYHDLHQDCDKKRCFDRWASWFWHGRRRRARCHHTAPQPTRLDEQGASPAVGVGDQVG